MTNIDRRNFIKTMTGATVGGLLALNSSVYSKLLNTSETPNLLFIFPDQFRRQAMGFWSKPEYQGALNGTSDPVITTNIDKLANEGIVLNQAVSTHPLCSPYRGMMLSGIFPQQNGIKQNCTSEVDEDLREDLVCITDVLSNVGFDTAYFGKTHWIKPVPHFDGRGNYVGPTGSHYINKWDTYIPPGPDRHSVKYWYQNILDRHKDAYAYSNDPNTIGAKSDGEVYRPHEYTPLNEANHIIDYIGNTNGQRDTEKPFCLFWSLNPPHNPYSAIEDCDEDAYNEHYKDIPISTLLNRPNVTTNIADDNVRYYFANITGVDKQIGRVLSELDSRGLKDNTIVVFTSDHGEMMGSHNKMDKSRIYEESFGVPFIISYPAKLNHRIENLRLGSTDIMPTLLGLMGFKNEIPDAVEGTDYSELLLDETTQAVIKPASALFLAASTRKGVQTDKYTFTVLEDGSVSRLFNNKTDPYQRTNLDFSKIPREEQTFLLTELGSWLAKANDLWYQEKKFANFIIYPGDNTHIGKTP